MTDLEQKNLEKFLSFPKAELILFDCDGVLVDSEPVAQQATVDFAAKYGVHLTVKEAEEHFLGHAMPKIVNILSEMAKEKLPENAEDELRNFFISLMKEKAKPLTGVKSLLQRLNKENIPFHIGSNSSLKEMVVKFEASKIAEDIKKDHIHSAADMKQPKPDPAVYLLGAEKEGISPEKTIVVEDSDTGAKAAFNAGMRCILLRSEGQKAPGFFKEGQVAIAHNIAEVEKIIFAAVTGKS
ncbi:HAD family phosphatase [Acetobacteraceae bacterium]|nr:HAD family phosphatase [Acetobacteraceae bacterium]